MTQHHPTEEYLVHYAAGALPLGQAILVASHLTYCRACRASVREAEALGGSLLEAGDDLAPAVLPESFPFDAPAGAPMGVSEAVPAGTDIPAPLRPYVGSHLSAIRWRTFWPGMQTLRIRCEGDAADVSLLRLQPGKGMPIHSHGGDELTLVLQGSYTDETGRYRAGDVATGEPTLTHRPVADEGGPCVCFTVIEAPLKFTSPLARLASRVLLR
jgi:putative transcriptional regulator